MKFSVTVFLALAALPLGAAEPNADCSRPFVFRDARVNILILPYRNLTGTNADLERASWQLTLLLQQTILFSALKYPSIGVVRTVASDPDRTDDCTTAVVSQKILGNSPGAMQQLSSDGAAILLWGQIYKEGEQVYLCSYARLLRRGSDIAMETTGGGHGVFSARLPANAVTFPPRVISTGLLQQIGSAYREASIVHSDRNVNSSGFELPVDPREPFPYQVLEATPDGWMRIRGMRGGQVGWIYASESVRSRTLAANLPELHFIDGAIGYLQFAKASDWAGIRDNARRSLEAFAETGASQDTSLATATAKSMLAVMLQRDASTRPRGYQLSREAVGLAPYNADARNLELIYRLDVANRDIYQNSKWQAVAQEFAQAAALGAGKKYILDNLDSFYNGVLAVQGLTDNAAAAEIRKRRGQLAALREAR